MNMKTNRCEVKVSKSLVLGAFGVNKSVRDIGLAVIAASESKALGKAWFDTALDWGIGIAVQAFFRDAKALWGRIPAAFTVVVIGESVSIEVACKGGAVAVF